MMAKDPAQRLQSAAQVIARLAPWVDPTARPQPASSELESRWMSYSGGFPPPIIIPPPVLIAPLESSAAAAAAGGSLRDTVTDVPTPAQHAESDSGELSVELDVPSMIPLVQPLLLCIVMPLVLVGLLTFIAFLVKKLLS